MTTAEERLAQTQLDDRKQAAITELRNKYGCSLCVQQGVKPINGKCPRCKGTEIDPDSQEKYDRELREIELKFSLNPQ